MSEKEKRGQNEGSIRQRKDGSWEARFSTGKREKNGKMIRKSIYGKSITEVRRALKLALAQVQESEYIIEKDITLGAWLKEWLEVYKKNSVRATTYDSHYTSIKAYIIDDAIGEIKLKNLRNDHIQRRYNNLLDTLAPATIKRLHAIVKCGLDQAVKNEMIRKNPAVDIKLPAIKKTEIRIMTHDEQKKFQKALKCERLRPAFIFALQSGLRLGELLSLKWDDIDLKNETVSIKRSAKRAKIDFSEDIEGEEKKIKSELIIQQPKSAAGRRTVPLMPTAIAILQEHEKKQLEEKKVAGLLYSRERWVFCNELGNIIEPRNFLRTFKKILTDNELQDINFHALRHTFVSRMLEAGVNVKTISEIIGHSKTSLTLDIYSHILPEQKQSAIKKINHLFK